MAGAEKNRYLFSVQGYMAGVEVPGPGPRIVHVPRTLEYLVHGTSTPASRFGFEFPLAVAAQQGPWPRLGKTQDSGTQGPMYSVSGS